MTRREQLGSEDHQLANRKGDKTEKKPVKTPQMKRPAAAKGRGRGRGKQTKGEDGKSAEAAELENKSSEAAELENKSSEAAELENKSSEAAELENKSSEAAELENKSSEAAELENKSSEAAELENKSSEAAELENKSSEAAELENKSSEAAKKEVKGNKTKLKTNPDQGQGTKRTKKTEKDEPEKSQKKQRTAEPKGKAKAKAKTKKGEIDQSEEVKEKRIETATWAGRWVPSDPGQHTRMAAIKDVFDRFVAPKVRSQSTLAPPFFKVCTGAFKCQGLTESSCFDDYVASAELQVEGFMTMECVRCLDLNVGSRCPFFLLGPGNKIKARGTE